MSIKDEDIHRLLEELDGSGSGREWSAAEELRAGLGARLPRYLLERYRSERKANARSSCVYHAIRYARDSQDAVNLGLEAVRDRSGIVRYRACMLLAYALRKDAVPPLRSALNEVPETSRADVLAAIDAIESGNHHYFVDRDHSGLVTLNIERRTNR